MKRLISLLLAPMLLLGLAMPALGAEETADARLKRVTEAVKETLDLDTEQYDDFSGSHYEQELGTTWDLYWNGDGGNLNVSALEDGTVLSYWCDDGSDVTRYRGEVIPTLSKADADAAKTAAEDFLKKVLVPGLETVEAVESRDAGRLGNENFYFRGTVLLNGLPSPLNWNVTVRGIDSRVVSFSRDAAALQYLGGVPSPDPALSESDAAAKLRTAQKLELIYVPDEADPQRAVLRYVTKLDRPVYVDARTGALIDPRDEIYFAYNTAEAAQAMDMGTGGSARKLTQAEQAGVDKLQGVLSSAELDKLVRGETAYMLDGFALSSTDYQVVKEDGGDTVLATLRYNQKDAEDPAGRFFTVDAREGAVRSLWSYDPWTDRSQESKVSADAALAAAEDFLPRFTAHAGDLALYATEDNTAGGAASYGFTFARQANGYPFPTQSCTVRIDRFTGAVTGLDLSYDEGVTFDAAEGVISPDAALDAWMAAHDLTLAYRAKGRELDPADPAEAKLIDMGRTSILELVLSYGLEREAFCAGIDAKTGEAVSGPQGEEPEVSYSDVSGHWAEPEILALAAAGVGYNGGVFAPDKPLTQWDMVCLIYSANGWRVDPATEDKDVHDSVYNTAYRMGALTRNERKEEAPVDRLTLVTALLNSAGFGEAAGLQGIYTVSYPDAALIPAESLGYAAIAQALGMVKGALAPQAQATRAEAAAMLYRLMDR